MLRSRRLGGAQRYPTAIIGMGCVVHPPLVDWRWLMVSPLRRVPFGSRPKRNQKGLPRHSGLAALDFPHFIIAPWARCDGPSMAQRSSRGILPLNPLRNDYVRPAEGALSRPELICSAVLGIGFEVPHGVKLDLTPAGRVDNAQLVHRLV